MSISEPLIITKTARGESAHSIIDEMFKHRELLCSGEITSESADSLISQILYLAQEDPEQEITFFIDSPGGSVVAGLSLYDTFQGVQCPIHTICLGEAASMGAVLFAAGDTRDILPHAFVMIHDPLTMGIQGSALSVKSESDLLMRTRTITCELLAKHTGKKIEEIYEKTSQDSYFWGSDAVDFGLADRVITTLNLKKEE